MDLKTESGTLVSEVNRFEWKFEKLEKFSLKIFSSSLKFQNHFWKTKNCLDHPKKMKLSFMRPDSTSASILKMLNNFR